MKQLKIKNAQQAKENGSCKEWCCGRLFDSYHNLCLHREGTKHKKKNNVYYIATTSCIQLC